MRRVIQIIVCVFIMTASCAARQMPPMVTREQAEAALQAALTMVGTRYVWGGQTPSGFDCSGLAIWAYNQSVPGIKWFTGDSLTARTTAHVLFVYNVKPMRPRDVWPGDMVFVTNTTERVTHMGLFSRWLDEDYTKFEWVEASSAKKGVVVSTWDLNEKNSDKMFVAVGRVVLWPPNTGGG